MFWKFIKNLLGKKEESKDAPQTTKNTSNREDNGGFLDFELIQKKFFIRLESAYRHQEIVLRRATEVSRLCLGEFLFTFFNFKKTSIETLAVMYREAEFGSSASEEMITDPDEIWSFDLFSTILKNKTDEGHYTHGMFHETTIVAQSETKNYILTMIGLGGTDTIKYMRVTLLVPDTNFKDDSASLKTNNAPISTSCILSYSEVENNPELLTYEIVENNVNRKHQSNEEFDELEREYIYGQFEFNGGYYIGYGNWLFSQNRYYDAYSILERAFNYLRNDLDESDPKIMQVYYKVCNTIGHCLTKMDREDEASYFYKQGSPATSLDEPNYLALSYARLGNPTAINIMNNWMIMVAQQKRSHENWSEDTKQFTVDVPESLSIYKVKVDKYLSENPIYREQFTIGDILNLFFGIKRKNLAKCMFIYDTTSKSFSNRLEDSDAIYDFSVCANKIYVLSCTHVHYITNDDEDKSILCHNAPIVISTHSIDASNSNATMRIDLHRCNFSNNDDKRNFVRRNDPQSATFCIGNLEKFDFSTDNDSLLNAIRKAIELVDQRRMFEAYQLSKWVFECTSTKLKDENGIQFESKDELLWEIFFESSYQIGYTLMELGKIYTAAYYLEIASHSSSYRNVQEYINCLSNSKDPQALEVVEDVIKRSPKPESDEDMEEWNFHMAFLKRRKAYILIDKNRISEARILLQEMANEPLNKGFAQRELQYLENLERNIIQ